MDTWTAKPPEITVEELLEAAEVHLAAADGVTVSGGEPFDQPEALEQLLKGLRRQSDGDILVFSGYGLEWLAPWLSRLDGLIDCLVTDPFVSGEPQTRALRGSDNQRMVFLTELGRERFGSLDRHLTPDDRVLDVLFDDENGQVFLAGIPRPGDMRKLARLLQADSHQAVTTEGEPR